LELLILPKKRRKRRKKRGYPVAIMIGMEPGKATLWEIFSEQIKPLTTINLIRRRGRLGENELYNYHEEIIDAIRNHIREGLRSIILVNHKKSSFTDQFREHLEKHHKWLSQENSSNYLTIGIIEGKASSVDDVADLVETKEFKEIVEETTAEEGRNIILELEERLNKMEKGEVILYSLPEVEELTYGQWKHGTRKPEYVILTDSFLNNRKYKQRIHRLLQILNNKDVKTRVIEADSTAGERIAQFGGIVCFTKIEEMK
jgi:stalled ribosome rescue protein Dom34